MVLGDVNADILTGYWTQAQFDANPGIVLGAGQRIDLGQTGTYKVGDGVTALSVLEWLGGSSVNSVNGQTGVVVINYLPPRVLTITSASTINVNADLYDEVEVTALATNATIAAPTGTPANRQKLIYSIRDNGTPRNITYDAAFSDYTGSLPATTVAGKWFEFGAERCAADNLWNVIAFIPQP